MALLAFLLLGALVFAGRSHAEVESPPPPQVWSDKADYAPGEQVTLTGANWAPGESVHIRVNDDAGQTWSRDVDVVAGENGAFTDQFNLPEWFVATYTVTATGASSGTATWSFTDGNVRFDIAPAAARATFVENIYTAAEDCTGVRRTNGGFPDKTLLNSNGDNVGVGNSESLRVDASATTTNSPTLSFLAWSTTDSSPFTVIAGTNGLSACFPGFQGNGTRNYRATYQNAAPAIASNNATVTVNEGATASNTGTWSDANPAETVTLTASVGTVTKSGTNASGTWSWSFGTNDGPAQSQTVTITATDSRGLTATTSFALVVNNVSPSATFNAPASVNEGSNINLSLTGASDPSSVDTTSGFEYAFDCGSGYGPFSGANTASCSTNDNGSRSVKGKIRDKDGGVNEYTATVQVNNVAPTATFANDGPVDEGSSFHLSLNGASDPSSADTAAGFQYAFDCGDGSGYGAFSASNTATCPTTDNATRFVRGKVRDKDGGVNEYMASVTVRNVAPTIVSVTNDGPIDEGGSVTVTVTATDPAGAADPLKYEFDCGNDGFYEAGPQAGNTHVCSFADDGPYQVIVNVSDGDGGNTAGLTTVTVNNVAPHVTAADDQNADEGASQAFDLGSFTDPGDDGPWPVTVDWGDGSPLEGFDAADPGSLGSLSHTYEDGPNDYTGTITVSEAGSPPSPSDSDTFVVHVANIAPTATFTNDGPVDEGTSFHLALSDVFDPSAMDTAAGFEYAFDCGDGSGYGPYSGSSTATCPTTDDGEREVKGRVRDKDGDFNEYTATVIVDNLAPVVTAADDQASDEGENHAFDLGSFTDPGDDGPWSVDVDWGDGSPHTTFEAASPGSLGSANHTYADGPDDHTVIVTVSEAGFAPTPPWGSDSFDVHVRNVAPTVTFSASNDTSVNEGAAEHTYAFTVSDPGDDSFSVDAYGCGLNGDLVAGSLTTSDSGGSFKCVFPDGPATSSVHVRVSDSDGDSDSDSEAVQIVAVANVAPVVTLSGSDSADEGDIVSYSYTTEDPGDEVFSLDSESCGANGSLSNSSFDASTGDGSFDCTFPDGPASSSVSVSVSDGDDSGSDSIGVAVANVAPTVTFDASNDTTVDEGAAEHTYSYTIFDPGDDTVDAVATSCDSPRGEKVAGSDTNTNTSGSFKCTFPDGPEDADLTAAATDSDGDTGATAHQAVHVRNVAPTVVFSASNDTSVNEGAAEHTYAFTVSDPGDDSFSVDAYGCGLNGDLVAGSLTTSDSGGSFKCVFPDGPATSSVHVRVSDSDGDSDSDSEAVQIVAVANVAPTVDVSGDASADEGSTHTYTYTVSDPGDDPNPDITESCGENGDYVDTPADDSFDCTFPDGPASSTVSVTADDGDPTNNIGTDSIGVTVANVAPTVVFSASNDTSVNEGAAEHTYAFTVSDPGDDSFSVDAYGCGLNGDLVAGSLTTSDSGGSFKCVFPDGPASSSVHVRVSDSDGDSDSDSEAVQIVAVANVAPTATFGNDGPVDEGSTVTVSFSDQFDPSSGDTAAGFHYAYSCDGSSLASATYAGSGSSASHTCKFGDNGPRVVKGRILDRNDGGTTYETTVQVRNVDPTASNPSFVFDPVLGTATAGFDFSDAGWLDTHGPNLSFFTWSDVGNRFASVTEENGAPDATGRASDTRTLAVGCYNLTVTGTAKDDDGGQSAPLAIYSDSATSVVGRGFRPPIQDNERNIAKYGNVVPVKVVLTNSCTGATVTNVALYVTTVQGSGGEIIESTNVVAESVSAADGAGGQMRTADGMYFYNLATKNMTAGNDYTVRIRYGSSSGPVILAAVLRPKK